MKVLTAMYTIRRGGSYDRFIMMIEAFLERKWEVHCLSLTPIPIKHSFFYNHKMSFPFRKTDGIMAKFLVLTIFPIWAVLVGWKNKIDILVAFGSLYAFIFSISKCFLKKQMITMIRGNSNFGLRMQGVGKFLQYLNEFVEIIGVRLSNRIITNNEVSRNEILNNFKKGRGKDIEVLYNNITMVNKVIPEDIITIRERYGIQKDAKVLVTAGIINRGKNIEILIECLSKIKMDNIYLFVAGDSSTKADFYYKSSLKELINKLGVDQRVIFTGWLEKEEIWKVYKISDLFILPSLKEGMPNALLEALGCDLPCIGSDIPGINDILHYEDLLFDPKNNVIIADKVEKFFSNKIFANHVLQLCQERKKKFLFDWKEKVFQSITKGISLAMVN